MNFKFSTLNKIKNIFKVKYFILTVVFCLLISFSSKSQNVKGIIVSDTGNITILKLWGTHEERGFAYGYLLGNKIKDIYEGYFRASYGALIPLAKQIIMLGNDIRFDSIYIKEAVALVKGMDSAGINHPNIDYLDILLANSFLDISCVFTELQNFKDSLGCSSLISWGDATAGTDLNGKSIISRHLDWTPNAYITRNQVIAINFPSENTEQPWLLIGFAGQIGALSGINKSGLGVFQHQISDFTGNSSHNQHYEPIWITLRKALETKDFNNDNVTNVQDLKSALLNNSQGYASGFIISAVAPYSSISDSLIAVIAELIPSNPKITFRCNEFPDSIPGDNIYTANYEIKRNNHYHFCNRYNGIINNIGNGTNISSTQSWDLMKNYSHIVSNNIQFIQYVPENNILKIAVYKNNKAAYLNNSYVYNTNDLFSPVSNIHDNYQTDEIFIKIFPNPIKEYSNIEFYNTKEQYIKIDILDLYGNIVCNVHSGILTKGNHSFGITNKNLTDGFYFCRLNSEYCNKTIKFSKIK